MHLEHLKNKPLIVDYIFRICSLKVVNREELRIFYSLQVNEKSSTGRKIMDSNILPSGSFADTE